MHFYAFLSNAYTSALEDTSGSIDWLPLPRFDSPAVFSRILDARRGGFFRISVPRGQIVDRRYLPGTLVLSSLWQGPEGRARVIDYLPVGHPELRRVIFAGCEVEVDIEPRFYYGQIAPAYVTGPDGAVFENQRGGEALILRLRPGGSLRRVGDHAWRLGPGRHEVVLRYTLDLAGERGRLDRQVGPAGADLRREIKYWRDLPTPRYTGPMPEAFDRSLLVIRGLTFRPNGAIIAAPTTSLPEALGEGRQWDYRYVWVRDGAYAVEALVRAGDLTGARRCLEFFLNAAEISGQPFPRPFFRVDGTPAIGEQELLWLAGHLGSRPVRAGNAASDQVQGDVEGDFMAALAAYVDASGDLAFPRYYERTIRAIVDWTLAHWKDPDAGLWEFRGPQRRITHSALMAWVALSEGARLLTKLGRRRKPAEWAAAARDVRAAIEAEAQSSAGRYGQSLGDPAPDASLLLMPLVGFCRPDDPAFSRTLATVERDLVEGPFVYRYRQDDLGQARHPFLLATSWLARVYARRGEPERAYNLLAKLYARATTLGLLGEHVNPDTGRPLGNFPQLFSHVGLVTALAEISAAESGRPPQARAGG